MRYNCNIETLRIPFDECYNKGNHIVCDFLDSSDSPDMVIYTFYYQNINTKNTMAMMFRYTYDTENDTFEKLRVNYIGIPVRDALKRWAELIQVKQTE